MKSVKVDMSWRDVGGVSAKDIWRETYIVGLRWEKKGIIRNGEDVRERNGREEKLLSYEGENLVKDKRWETF